MKMRTTIEEFLAWPIAMTVALLLAKSIENYYIGLMTAVLFINIIAIFYITKNVRLEVKISYNRGEDD